MKNLIIMTVEQLRGFLLVAPKDEIRLELRGVYFDSYSGHVVATNGTILLVGNFKGENRNSEILPVIIHRAELAKVVKGGSVKDQLWINFDNSKLVKITRFPKSKDTAATDFECALIQREFPEWKRVIPGECSNKFGNYAPAVVDLASRSLRKVLELPVGHNAIAELTHNDTCAGVMTFEKRGSEAIAIVMPFRGARTGNAELSAFRETL